MNKKAYIILALILFLLGMILFLVLRDNEGEEDVPLDPLGFPTGEGDSGLASREGAFDYLNDEDALEQIRNEPLTLAKIVDAPVAGYVIFEKEVSTSTTETVVRFAEMGTGHLFELNLDQATSQRISNTTVPKTNEAVWSSGGDFVLLRYETEDKEGRRNFLAQISDSQREGVELDGNFLPDDIQNPAFAPTTNDLFYLRPTPQGADGLIYDANSNDTQLIFSTPIREWLSSWIDSENILMVTKPSADAGGIAYTVSISSGGFSKIVGSLEGLTATLFPQGEVFFTTSLGNGLSNRIRRPSGVEDLSITTLADKCTRTSSLLLCAVPNTIPVGDYPDIWYQGRVSFEDSIWSITGEGVIEFYTQLTLNSETIDAVSLSALENHNLLLFKNKKDHSLWLLNTQLPTL